MRMPTLPVFKAEQKDGVADAVRSTTSLAYHVPVHPLVAEADDRLRDSLCAAFAAHQGQGAGDGHGSRWDLYYLKDIMVTTGWNKNRDVFDLVDTWVARHTPEDKPFNFEHRPLDIIGHITSSRVVDEAMREVNDDIAVDELPSKFHVVNGSVLYMALADEERRKLMQQTVEEIKRGEWFVSMECLFRNFDYGVIGPDGSHVVVARNESSAWMTKHLAQYGGTGSYRDEHSGQEFTLGRVLRNFTFSGKGLVRKPANPESVILNSVAAFHPTPADSGYLTAGPVATSSTTEESNPMPESNAVEQALSVSRDENRKLEKQVDDLRSEIASLRSKDTETAIAKLQKDLADRDAVIAERDKTIAGLNTQINAITESSKSLEQRAVKAEADLATANDALSKERAKETRRSREAILRERHAPKETIATLVDSFAVLDDEAFAKTVDTIAASWKSVEPVAPQKAAVVATAVKNATPEPEPAMATASEDTAEASHATVVSSLESYLKATRGARPSVYAASE